LSKYPESGGGFAKEGTPGANAPPGALTTGGRGGGGGAPGGGAPGGGGGRGGRGGGGAPRGPPPPGAPPDPPPGERARDPGTQEAQEAQEESEFLLVPLVLLVFLVPFPFLLRSGSAEPCRVDRDVRLDLFQLRCIPSIQPRELVFKRKLDTANALIVEVID